MTIINKDSLAGTLSNIRQAVLEERPLSRAVREDAAAWIASRLGGTGAWLNHVSPNSTGSD